MPKPKKGAAAGRDANFLREQKVKKAPPAPPPPVKIAMCIDPAGSTGYCLSKISSNGKIAKIYTYGFLDVDNSSEYQGDHCIDLMDQLRVIMEEHSVETVGIEDYFFSKRFANGSNVNAAYRAAIWIVCRERNIPYTVLNISQWKNFVAGRKTPTKEQKKLWGVEPSKKLYMQQALWDRYGFRFPNHSISNTTGKPIIFRFDIIDVVAMMVYFARIFLNVGKVVMDVEVPEDHVFKKPPKKMFVYPV